MNRNSNELKENENKHLSHGQETRAESNDEGNIQFETLIQ